MADKGYLDGKEMAAAFRLLRSNSLTWHYVVHGWLYGEAPPAFDVLYWNMDATRMPQAMHAWYLRELYLRNRLIQPGALTVAGEPLDLSAIGQAGVRGGRGADDHIAPWEQTFKVLNHVVGDKRYVLSSSATSSIVNPPVHPPKRKYWADTAHRSDTTAQWKSRAEEYAGSWWPDWMAARPGPASWSPPPGGFGCLPGPGTRARQLRAGELNK